MTPLLALCAFAGGPDAVVDDGPARATGSWGGARPWLDHHGVTLEPVYTADLYRNLHGGVDTHHTDYHGNVDLTLVVDTERVGAWRGGRLTVYGQNGHGRGATPHVGAYQLLSNVEAGPFTALSEYFFEQSLPGEVVRIKVGKQDANRDFGTPRYAGNFVVSSSGVIPTVPMPTFPAPALGAVLFVEPVAWLSLRAAVYDGAPRVGGLGFDTAFDGEGGAVAILAAVLKHTAGPDRRGAGFISLGAWGHNGDFPAVTTEPMPRVYPNNYGVFAIIDQRLFEESDDVPDRRRGAHAFLRLGADPPDRNALYQYVGAGLTYHGALAVRPDDTVGLGMSWARLGRTPLGLVRRGSENVAELFYKARVTQWLSFEPEIQYVVTPGGEQPDAFVLGMRSKLKL